MAPAEYIVIGRLKVWKGMYLISHKSEGVIQNSIRYRVTGVDDTNVTLEMEGSGKAFVVAHSIIGRVMRYG